MATEKPETSRTYEVPIEFWFAYLELHTHLMLDTVFTWKVFGQGPGRDQKLSKAFGLVEYYFDKFWINWCHDQFEVDA